jgi:hypothetical protein
MLPPVVSEADFEFDPIKATQVVGAPIVVATSKAKEDLP